MAARTSRGFSPREFLQGGRPAPEKVVRASMADLERTLRDEFKARAAEHKRLAKVMRPSGDAILGQQGKDPRLLETARQLKGLDAGLSRKPLKPPRVLADEERFGFDPMLVNRVPPYDYVWSWSGQFGGAVADHQASRYGRISFWLSTQGRDTAAEAASAVGIFFRPQVNTGTLRLSSNPVFNSTWWTFCFLASARSSAWIGLRVRRFTSDGDEVGGPVSQQTYLWDDDSWFNGAGKHEASDVGHPLSAQFGVDSGHWYSMWVWCGGYAMGDGFGSRPWGGAAGSGLSVTVPSITWDCDYNWSVF